MNKLFNSLISFLIRFIFGMKCYFSDFKGKTKICSYIDYNYLKYHGVEAEYGSVRLIGFPIIKKAKGSTIAIGRGVTLVSHSRGNPAGINHPVILATLSEGAILKIGDGVGLSGSAICAASRVEIGNFSGLGANATIYDTDFHSAKDFGTRLDGIRSARSNPVRIGKQVWVGANALILKGVEIGDKAVIGAGSVVRENVPAGKVVLGNPSLELNHNEHTV